MGTEKVFKRKLYDKMLNWKQTRVGSTALLVKGARRVGKSTIVEEFARREYESYILVDFADAPAALWEAVTLYPMDYEEFRWALGDNVTIEMLRECFQAKHSLGNASMRKLLRKFRAPFRQSKCWFACSYRL